MEGARFGAAYVAEISLQTLRTLWRERHGSTEPAISALRVASLISLWGLVLAHAPANMFDRYLVAALPSLLVLAVLEGWTREDRLARVRWRAALGLLVVMGGFAGLALIAGKYTDRIHGPRLSQGAAAVLAAVVVVVPGEIGRASCRERVL